MIRAVLSQLAQVLVLTAEVGGQLLQHLVQLVQLLTGTGDGRVHIGPQQVIRQAAEQLAGLARTVQQGSWNDSWYLELLPPGCDKGSALRMVNRYLGIPRAGSLCFGDGANDLDMFRAAGTRVAVRGSCPALVQLADSLCGPPSESGIAQELVRRHILPAPPQTQKGA